jgi:hypothetical protein
VKDIENVFSIFLTLSEYRGQAEFAQKCHVDQTFSVHSEFSVIVGKLHAFRSWANGEFIVATDVEKPRIDMDRPL